MDKQTEREIIKGRLVEYVEGLTQKSKGANMYVCPLCGSGTGHNRTGAFSIKDGTSWKCFRCGESGDVFDLIGKMEHITDFNGQLERAREIFRYDNAGKTNCPSPGYQKQAGKERTKEQEAEQEKDYSDYFLRANRNLERTSYHRGISMETLNRFMVGYDENWTHPKAPQAPPSPRLIIPTSKHSYLARDTRENLTPEQAKYDKQKVGEASIFNKKALYTAQKPVFIVEGELDAMSIVDVGGEAVALGSVSNVGLFLALLKTKKPVQPLIIALDNDEAGEKACEELSNALQGLKIPFYGQNPAGVYKDPNEALQRNRDEFRAAVEQAENIEAETMEVERETLKREAVAYSLQDFQKNIEESKRAAFFPTGFSQLDTLLDGGLYAGLYVVGAISSLGKTTFCLQIADQIAASGQDVLIFSLEMARNELIAKSVSRLTFIHTLAENGNTANAKTTRGILTGTRYDGYSQRERELIQRSVAAYGEYARNIYITEGIGNVGAEEIKDKVAKHIKLIGKAPVVMIDYLQILAPYNERATDKQNTDKAVLELKRLSRDYSIPVVGISSFNRDNYTAPVNLASFKESGAIEYSSDVLIGLQYDGMDYQEGEADKAREKRIRELMKEAVEAGKTGRPQKIQVKILKNRNGSKGEALLDFYPMFNYFTDENRANDEELIPIEDPDDLPWEIGEVERV